MGKFAVFDFDGTLIRWQLYHSVVDKLNKLGHIDPADFERLFTDRMSWKTRKSDDIFRQYEKTLVGVYEKAIKGLSYDVFLQASQEVFDEHKDQVYTYTRSLLGRLKKQGYTLLAISGSQTEIVALVAKYWGFDDWTGSEFEVKDGRFTGRAELTYGNKRKILLDMIKKHSLDLTGSIAVGDSESDIDMLEMVENPIAFNPNKELLNYARKRKWNIVIERKNVVYELNHTDGSYKLA